MVQNPGIACPLHLKKKNTLSNGYHELVGIMSYQSASTIHDKTTNFAGGDFRFI